MAKFPGQTTAETIKKQIKELKRSYHNPYDVMTELIQNAIDAVNQCASNNEPGYKPTVEIFVSRTDKTIKIRDNGNGMSTDELDNSVQMYHTGKENESNTIGEKGVGLSFALFSTDAMVMKTVHNNVESTAKITGANSWLNNSQIEDPFEIKVESSSTNHQNGTEIIINTLINNFVFSLTKEQFIYYLRSQTAVGNFENAFEENDGDSVKIVLNFTDEAGNSSITEVPYKYYLLDDIQKSNILNFATYKKDASALDDSQKRTKLSDKYITFKGSRDVSDREVKWIGYYVPSNDVWDKRNNKMGHLEQDDLDDQFPKLKYGPYLSVKNMPTGITFDAETKGDSGYFNRLFVLINDDTLTFDLGRKSVEDGRKVKTHKKIVKEEFNNYRKYIAKYVKKSSSDFSENDDEAASTTISRMEDEQERLSEDYDTKFFGTPEQEGTIAAIFFEQVGKGKFGELTFFSHGYHSKYDVYAKQGYVSITMDFKQRIGSFLQDVNSEIKDASELNYIVTWSLSSSDRNDIKAPKNAVTYEEAGELYSDHFNASGYLNFSNVKNKVYVIELEKICKL